MKNRVFFFMVLGIFTLSVVSRAYGLSYAIKLNGYHDLTISGRVINGGNVPAITLTNCHNIHITKNLLGNSSDAGIYLYNCYNITIDYNKIANVSTGVYVVNTTRGGISVVHNQFRNMHGPMPRGQFVQFNNVNGPYNTISYNRGENIPGDSNPEDAINIFKSTGTPDSPIKIVGNRIRGGGPSKSGGGIMLGDNGGGYQVASGNILVDPGQYGIAVAGGDHIALTGNMIYGRAQYFTNVGIYVWGQGGYHCSNITVSRNRVRFMNAKNMENDSWIGTGESKPAGWDNNEWGAQIGPAILPRAIVSF
ncbi:MAG TPA: right-handed parallel beta-helix repeat-containing protein [Mucilaginibacter sp.]|jgi:parallel beta-helix repeat protein|nr:right-handed parallel beta-helix repeat-containing protein [Mucilaginibacter sp.]